MFKKYLFLSILCTALLNAHNIEADGDTVDVDNLLNHIHRKTDLSSKTKLENGGVYTIYTRDDLKRMQVRNLKDILKSVFPMGYNENKYGLPDPYYSGSAHPYSSSNVRVYIDNQEISTGLYGSGLVIYGDMDIGFVDHIEVYTANPTYEFSTEPTFTLIKMYSKKAQKDEGSSVSLGLGSRGSSRASIYNTQELDNDWSYFVYASQDNQNRKKYDELSRDKKVFHIFASFYNDNHRILLDAGRQEKDSFIDLSSDASPLDATIDNDFFHLGYDASIGNFSYLFSYDFLKSDSNFRDDVTPLASQNYMFPVSSLHSKSKAYVINSEFKYKYNIESNNLIAGLKFRYKDFKYDLLNRNGIDLPESGNSNQTVATAFIENQYSIEENSILTTGFSTSSVKNNNSVQDDNLYLYRIGHTYTTPNWTFKTIFSHIEYTLDPYLINAYDLYITEGKKDVTKQNIFLENIKYKKDNNEYQLTLSKTDFKDGLVPSENNDLFDNCSNTVTAYGAFLSWTHHYNKFDKLYVLLGYENMSNLPTYDVARQYSVNIRNLNTYKKFDIYNELLYSRGNVFKKNFYDYSFGVIYHKTKDFSISVKAVNIFDRARTSIYPINDPATLAKEGELNISPIDRRVEFTLEYLF